MKRKSGKKVYVSFDYDNDKALKSFIMGQAKKSDTPFKVTDFSIKEAAPEKNWERKAREKIKRSDMVIVMTGKKTRSAPGVKKEIIMAREEKKKVVQIIGYKGMKCPRVKNAGVRYQWNYNNLKNILK